MRAQLGCARGNDRAPRLGGDGTDEKKGGKRKQDRAATHGSIVPPRVRTTVETRDAQRGSLTLARIPDSLASPAAQPARPSTPRVAGSLVLAT